MSRRTVWIALWVASIVATAQYVKAQRTPDPTVLVAPMMVTGDDFAFRIQSYGPGQTAIGRFMVRVNGIWQVAVQAPSEGRVVPTGGN